MKRIIIIICILFTVVGLGGGGCYLYVQEQQKQQELREIHGLLEQTKQATVEEKIGILQKLEEKELYTETNLRDELLKDLQAEVEITDAETIFRFLEGLPKEVQQDKQKAYVATVDTIFSVGGKISKIRHSLYKGYLEKLYLDGELDFEGKIALLANFYADKKVEKLKKLETELQEEYTSDPKLYSSLAAIQWKYAEKKDIFQPEILALYKKAIELEPTNAHFYSTASIFVSENMHNILSKSLAENKSLHYSDSVRKEIREKYGKTALNYAKKAVELDPENPYYHYKLAEVYFREMQPGYGYLSKYAFIPMNEGYFDTTGNLPKVIASAQKAYEFDKENEFYAQNLMNLAYYFNKDKYRNIAINIGKDFFEKHPENYTMLNNYAVLITQNPTKENLQQALELMKKSYEKEQGFIAGKLKIIFKNYLYIAALAKDEKTVKKLLQEMDDSHYESMNLQDAYIYGEAFSVIGKKELGDALRASGILMQSYYTHLTARQVLAHYDIYLTSEYLQLVTPAYASFTPPSKDSKEPKIIDVFKEKIKAAVATL